MRRSRILRPFAVFAAQGDVERGAAGDPARGLWIRHRGQDCPRLHWHLGYLMFTASSAASTSSLFVAGLAFSNTRTSFPFGSIRKVLRAEYVLP